MKGMTYRSCAARIEHRDEGQRLVGHIAGITHVVGFHSQSVVKLAPQMGKDAIILVNLSGRGDKDLDTVMKEIG